MARICSTSIEIPAPEAKPGSPGGDWHIPVPPTADWSASCLFLTLPSTAAAEVSWVLRAGAVWVDPGGGSRQTLPDGDRVETGFDADFGLAVTAEVRTRGSADTDRHQ